MQVDIRKFGSEIGSLRSKADLSLEAMVEQSGIGIDRLKKIESGNVKKIKRKDLKRLSNVFMVPAYALEYLAIDPQPQEKKKVAKKLPPEKVQAVIRAIIGAQLVAQQELNRLDELEDELEAKIPVRKKKKKK